MITAPIRFIYFDCMDTLIQMDISSMEVYAEWAHRAADGLGIWKDAAAFRQAWKLHRKRFQEEQGDLREGTILGRIRDLLREEAVRLALGWTVARIESEAAGIHDRYWARYRSSAFVLPEVPETLEELRNWWRIPLGVLSNFMVEGGIPGLLSQHRLRHFFEVVLVSCDQGWRKPCPTIFETAIREADQTVGGVRPEEILFVGDDLNADYRGAEVMGLTPLLYDPRGLHPGVERRIESFREIAAWLAAGGDGGKPPPRDPAGARRRQADPCPP